MHEPMLPISDSVTIEITASPERLWPLAVDAATPARFSSEVEAAAYVEGDVAALGATIEGHNVRGDYRWSTHSTVIEFDAHRRFTWPTGDAKDPVATWTFLIDSSRDRARLTHEVTLHAGHPPRSNANPNAPARSSQRDWT